MHTTYALVMVRHNAARATVKRFDTIEEAIAAGEAITPDIDGMLLPNIPEATLARWERKAEYQKGMFWHGNRYAAIFSEN